MTDRDETYNGWTNYPTWCVNLWLENDEGLYDAARELVSATKPADEFQTKRLAVSMALAEWVTQELAPDLGASFVADLLGYAFDQVAWHEIADMWIQACEAEKVA